MFEELIKNLSYHYEPRRLHKLLAFIPDQRLLLIDIISANTPETLEKEEMEEILSRVLNHVKWNSAESLQGIQAEYYYDWKKDKESGASKGSLLDFPGFDGVVAINPISPPLLVRYNDAIKKDLKEGNTL